MSARAAAISAIVSRSALRITGTTSPRSVATAMPTFAVGKIWIASSAKMRVHLAVPHQRDRGDLREDVGDGRLRAALGQALDELRAQRVDARHVGGHRDLEGGHLPRLGQPARDRLAQRGQRDRLDLARRRAAASPAPAPRRRARRPRRRSGPPGPVPRERGEVDAALARDPARERRRLDAAVGAAAAARRFGRRRLCRLADAARPRSRSRRAPERASPPPAPPRRPRPPARRLRATRR